MAIKIMVVFGNTYLRSPGCLVFRPVSGVSGVSGETSETPETGDTP